MQKTFIRTLCQLHKSTEIRTLAQRFASEKVKPIAAQIDREGHIPASLLKQLHQEGFLSVCVKKIYGGLELDYLSLSETVQEISRACGSTGSVVSIHNCLFANLLNEKGTEEQIQEHLVPLLKNQSSLGAFALSEAEAGSDVANMRTTATRKTGSESWILNGQKAWVTSASEATCGIFFATIDKSKLHKGITAFIIPFDSEGLVVETPDSKMGIRGTSTCSIRLENVVVPARNVLGELGNGFKVAMNQLVAARVGIASQALGIAQSGLDSAIKFIKESNKIDQMTKLYLADMTLKMEGARMITEKAATIIHQPDTSFRMKSMYSSLAKIGASECATFNALSCGRIMKEELFREDAMANVLFRDSRITEIYGGITDIQKFIVADSVLASS